ncbi:MAG: response regulator transcription factor [Planctomycetes bacterium]|nr:response regulator transcription factor [Planctomycetota bacterium]
MTDRILIVEDEPTLAEGVRAALAFAGYAVEIAANGEKALQRLRAGGLDLVLLDVMLPGLSGLEVLQSARAEGLRTPILLLTALGAERDRVRGLELGADDYVCKPFSVRELVARVGAHLRRVRFEDPSALVGRLRCGEVELDLQRLEAYREQRRLPLTAREGSILRYLWRHRGRVVTRDELLLKVWEYRTAELETRTVDATIAFLRKKIEVDTDDPRIVLTVRGQGYKIGELQEL